MLPLLFCTVVACSVPHGNDRPSAATMWSQVSPEELDALADAELGVHPVRFRLVRLDQDALAATLRLVQPKHTSGAAVTLALPTPDGDLERFEIWQSSVMAPELAARMTEAGWNMQTYAGRSLDRPATSLSLDSGGPRGFHAAVVGPGSTYYIDPRFRRDGRYCAVYYKQDLPPFHSRSQ
jgi:hypothetical protein